MTDRAKDTGAEDRLRPQQQDEQRAERDKADPRQQDRLKRGGETR